MSPLRKLIENEVVDAEQVVLDAVRSLSPGDLPHILQSAKRRLAIVDDLLAVLNKHNAS